MERAVDEFGFFIDSRDANPVSNSKNKNWEPDWLLFLQTGNWNQTQLKKMCRQGIPDSLRAQVWMKMANADLQRREGLYEEYLVKAALELDPITKDVIARDLSRTFPNHVMFHDPKGQGILNLRGVLSAYAVYNPSVGYCQGMGMVVGILLMRMAAEDAFYLLVAIVDRYMKDYYSPDLSQLRQDGLVFDHLLHKHSKRVARKLDHLEIDPLIYLTQWFMPIFTVSLAWRAVLRVWDMFFCDGVKTLHRIALGIMNLSQDYIIHSGNNTSEVLNYLLHIPKNMISPDELISASLKFRITKVDIEQIRRKIQDLERRKSSQSSSALAIKSKFNFGKNYLLFPKPYNVFLKSAESIGKTGAPYSDFSATNDKVCEATDQKNSMEKLVISKHSNPESDFGNEAALRVGTSCSPEDQNAGVDRNEDEAQGCRSSKLEDYVSSSFSSSGDQIIDQNFGT